MINKALDKIIKIIGTKQFNDTKILIDTDDKLPDDITFKNAAILMTCVIKMMINIICKYFQQKYCMSNKHGNNM